MSREIQSDWFVYMVRCADRSLYTGITTDVERRLSSHNEGTGSRYTRSRLPVELVYTETAADRGGALRRESQIKRLPAVAKRALIGE
jgi:predicted GIY-YIG superfamily endonuclease